MTRDDIIYMAQKAELLWNDTIFPYAEGKDIGPMLEKFAALVAAAEREKVAAWMRSKSYATGHGDTVEDLLKELEWQVAEREREACAEFAEEEANNSALTLMEQYRAKFIAEAIRARGEA